MTSRDYARLLPGASLALAAGILIGRGVEAWLLFAVMLALALLACLLLRWPQRFFAVMAAVMALGCLAGYAAYHPELPDEGDYAVSGVVVEEIRQREDGQVSTLLRDVALNGQPLTGGAYWSFYLDEGETLPEGLVPGCRVTLTARLYHPDGSSNPGGFDFRESLLQKGCTVGLYGQEELSATAGFHPLGLAAGLRWRLTQRLCQVMGDSAGSYAATMLLASRHLLPQEEREAFSRLGIAHILAVSGFHVGVLAGLLRRLFRALHLSRKTRLMWTGVLLALYCLLTGFNAPVVRATLLCLLYELGAVKHRQRSALHLLCAAFMVQLLVSPVQITSLSFQLTYGAVLGLILVAPWLEALWQPRRFDRLWRALCASLGAQIGILLPELYWFHELPLLGIWVNMAVIPLASTVIGLCWLVLLLLSFPPLATAAGWLTGRLMDGMLVGIKAVGSLPGITLWVRQANGLTAAAWVLLLVCMSWWWPHKRRWPGMLAALAALCLSVYPWPDTASRYMQFSVGEADAALLQDGGYAMAIDTGKDGQALASYLHQRRISLDALVLTHLHTDHAGGVSALLESGIPVRTCYLPYGAETAQVDENTLAVLEALKAAGTEIVMLSRGDVLALPNGSITVLWPEYAKVRPDQNANDSSLALLADVKGTSLLLTGDLSGTYEMYAAAPADVLKVAHHGSSGSTSRAFLESVAPRLLLLSCGTEERSIAMDSRRLNLPVANTYRDGCITLTFDDNGFTVESLR